MSTLASVKSSAHKAAFSPVMEVLTRLGYGVRGAIYVVMGLLAVQVALGKGGALASPQGAIAAIGKQPAGLILLWVVLVGILAYSVWGLVRAIWDPLDKGSDLKGVFTRLGYLASAVGYAFLAYTTYGLIKGASQSTSGSPAKLLASVMAMPLGRWAIALLGLIVVAVGLYQIVLGFKAGFEKQFQTYALNSEGSKTCHRYRTLWYSSPWSGLCLGGSFDLPGSIQRKSQSAGGHGCCPGNLAPSAIWHLASGNRCSGTSGIWVLFPVERNCGSVYEDKLKEYSYDNT